MKKQLLTTLLAASVLGLSQASAAILSVTFGDTDDEAATYDGMDVVANATFNTTAGDVAAPYITITGLDIDGIGTNDDEITVNFAITETGSGSSDVSLLGAGYALNPSYVLNFDITGATVTLGGGQTGYEINEIGFTETNINATGSTREVDITSPDAGFTPITGVTAVNNTISLTADAGIEGLSAVTFTATGTANQRVSDLTAQFDVSVVPEPSVIGLIAMGAFGLLYARRRK